MTITYVSNLGDIAPSNEQVGFTPEGGLAVRMMNKTGSASVRGTIVSTSSATDSAFITAPLDQSTSIAGIVYETGVADGGYCWVVVAGKAYVLLDDSGGSTKGYLLYLGETTNGRAEDLGDTSLPDISLDQGLYHTVGIALETKTSGTDVLCLTLLQFRYLPNVLSGV